LKGSALGFSFVTLVTIIGFALVLINAMVGVFIDIIPVWSLFVIVPISVLLIGLNALIVYGLSRKKNWAVFLGAIEVSILVLLTLIDVIGGGILSLISSILFLAILLSLLFALRRDYYKFKSDEEMHV